MGTSVDDPAIGGGGLVVTGDMTFVTFGIFTIGGSDLPEEGLSQLQPSRYQRTLCWGVGFATLAAGVPSTDFFAVLIGEEDAGLTSSRGLFLTLLVLVMVAGRGGGRLCP